MSEQISGGGLAKSVWGLISAALGGLLTWLTTGSSGIGPGLVALASVLCGIGGVAFSQIYRRYLGVLGAGANKKGSPSRETYDALRASLSEGNIAEKLYASRLTAFLDWIDRFFGDVGMADRTLLPRAFWLNTPAPLWTAPSFDRCLLIALIYPIATIFFIWAISGHVGPAEEALLLPSDWTGWRRGLAAVVVLLSALAFWLYLRIFPLWKKAIWILLGLAIIWLALAVLNLKAAIVLLSVFGGFAVTFTIAHPLIGGVAAIGAIVLPLAAVVARAVSNASGTPMGLVALSISWIGACGIIFGVTGAGFFATRYHRQGIFQLLLLSAMIVACLCIAYLMPPLGYWEAVGPLFLFIGLLTQLNAPFDWASLGLTRALLRRGLELGGWWPYILALADAVLAAIIIAILALTMVIGVQAFDHLAVLGGGKPILPLREFFDDIATNPTAPEFWWVYALLFSTMIPSLLNLMIGGASLLRGVPGLPSLLLQFMPAGKAVPTFERTWIALVLTLQIFLGALLGILAQAFLAVVVIVYIMPPFGLGLLDMAREVAAFDLPARIGRLFGGT